jgi:hypothetical protein
MRAARWGLGLFLALAACGGTGTDERATPVEVDPNNAAFLAVVQGEVSIRKADGAVAPAVADTTLARSDTLITGADGRVVVVLYNRHVVKLGTSLEKRVDTLAHFDDPPPSQDLAALFEEALGADYEQLGGKDKLERIAGWNARRASGETPAPVAKAPPPTQRAEPAEERKSDEPAPVPETPGVGVEDDDVPAEPVTADRLDAKKRDRPSTNTGAKNSSPEPAKPADIQSGDRVESSAKKAKESGRGDPGAGAPPPEPPKPIDPQSAPLPSDELPAPDLANEWTLETGSNGPVQRVKLPNPLVDRRAALARCLAESGKTALTLEVKGGTIRAAKFGAQAASCASGLVGVKLPDLDDATVTVRLKP